MMISGYISFYFTDYAQTLPVPTVGAIGGAVFMMPSGCRMGQHVPDQDRVYFDRGFHRISGQLSDISFIKEHGLQGSCGKNILP